MKGRKVWRAVGVVMGLTMLSRITGFLREMALAYGLGVSAHSDAYLFAYTLPNLGAAVLGVAAGKALLPLFAAHMAEGRHDRAWRLASSAFNATVLICLFISGIGMARADLLVSWLAPGFSADAHAEAVVATRIMLPGLVFYCTGSLVTTVLQTMRVFGIPSSTPIAQNALLMAGAFLVPAYGLQVLSWITLVAIALEVLVPALGFAGREVRYLPALNREDLYQFGRLALPLMVGSLAYQAVTAVDWVVASTTGEGSIAALSFADRLRQLPVGLFGATAATVLYPDLAEFASTGQMERFRRYMGEGLYTLLAVMVPSAAGLMLLRTPIISLLFQHGAFDARATSATAVALLWHAPGLVGLGAGALLSIGFFSLHDTITPVAVGLGGAALTVALDFLLAPVMGHGGIALAGSIAALGTAAALYLLMARRVGGLPLPWGTLPGRSIWASKS